MPGADGPQTDESCRLEIRVGAAQSAQDLAEDVSFG
jgi:hypothetical protein